VVDIGRGPQFAEAPCSRLSQQPAIPKKRIGSVENERSMIDRVILPQLSNKKVAAGKTPNVYDALLNPC
jgi:hypothetical protein